MSIHDINSYKTAKKALREIQILQESMNGIITLSRTHVRTYPYMDAIHSLAQEAKVALSISYRKYKAIVDSKGKLDVKA